MYRQIPVSSKIITRKIKERDSAIHESRLKQITSQVDSKRPDHFNPLLHPSTNKKKVQIMEVKYTEIERENRILLEKITKIMNPPKTTKNINQESIIMNNISRNGNYSTIQQYSQNGSGNKKKSMNQQNRRKELLNIMEENKRILERIKTRKSEYNHQKWEEEHKKKEILVQKISEYPVVLYKKSHSKNIFSNDLNYNPSNLQTNPSSISIKRQNNSLDRSIGMQHQKSGYTQKRDRSFHLEPLNSSNNRIDDNNNNKAILYRQSRQFGLNYYIIEISIENGIFRITADDIENPLTRVLEMFENDGLRVLNKFYNNNLEELVQNLKITDKIYIKGLERFQTEVSDANNTDYSFNQQQQNQQQLLQDQSDDQYENKLNNRNQMLINNKSTPGIYDRGGNNDESQGENGYTTNDSYQQQQQNKYTLSPRKDKQITNINSNHIPYSGYLQNNRRNSHNHYNNSNVNKGLQDNIYSSGATPNRKILREITEQNSLSNNNTLETRQFHSNHNNNTHFSPNSTSNKNNKNNKTISSNNNEDGFMSSKLAQDFFSHQNIEEQQQSLNHGNNHNQNNNDEDDDRYKQDDFDDEDN